MSRNEFAAHVKRTQGRLLLLLAGWLAAGSSLAQTTVEYIHTDALGSVVAVTNEAGQVIERFDYEPYGAIMGKPDYGGVGFTGHVQDAATGLTYMQQRYYDPICGCFLSVDPVTAYSNGDMRFFNRYAYAFNNPYKFNDPDGRCPFCPRGNPVAQARTQQATSAAQRHAAGEVVKMAPKGAIIEGGAGGAIGTGQQGVVAQGAAGALNNGNLTANAIYVTGGVAGKSTDGAVSLPSGGEANSVFVAGASEGPSFAAGLTNASTGADLEGSATLYQVNTPVASVSVTVSDSGIWTATVGTPDVGASIVKQPVETKVLIDHDRK